MHLAAAYGRLFDFHHEITRIISALTISGVIFGGIILNVVTNANCKWSRIRHYTGSVQLHPCGSCWKVRLNLAGGSVLIARLLLILQFSISSQT